MERIRRAESIANSDALRCPHRSVLVFGGIAKHMDSVVVHLRDVTEKQVTDFLCSAYRFQQGPPWIFEKSGDACLYINLYSEARQEYEPEDWAGVVAALGAEPSVSVIADVSGRHYGEGQERVFVRTMLSHFRGVALDGYTDYCWTLEDIISGKRVKGHAFFKGSMQKCSYCGRENYDASTNCRECGTPLMAERVAVEACQHASDQDPRRTLGQRLMRRGMPEDLPTPLRGTYWVLPRQLLAGEYPGEVEPEATEKKLRALVGAGIRTFVDLTDEGEVNEDAKVIPTYRNILRSVSEEKSVHTTYANIPIEDRGVPSPWTLRCILDVIDRSIADENPVFVHCWAGRGRTGTVVGCYLKRHGVAQDSNVIQKLAQLRKDVPNGRETSPHTKEQIRMVITWKKGV